MTRRGNMHLLGYFVVGLLGLVSMAACGSESSGDGDVTATDDSSEAAGDLPDGFELTVDRQAAPEDFAPACLQLDAGTLTGSYREFEASGTGVIVLSGDGSDDDVAALEQAWSLVGGCDDDVVYETWAGAPPGSSGWVADIGGGSLQYMALAVSGADVTIVVASGDGAGDAAADFLP